MLRRARYLQRVAAAYVLGGNSQVTFWHGGPAVNERAPIDRVGEYYMPFHAKADYPGPYDQAGIPQLNYRGHVGLQYNPIAIAQYGLGNYNLFKQTASEARRRKFVTAADWMVEHLVENPHGVWVWTHDFDWEYRTPLKAGWYSALSQGQGVSLLVRAHRETGDPKYEVAATRAFESFERTVVEGGVTYIDAEGFTWFEETIVEPDPPTHILNGFLWAAWGMHDYFLHTGRESAGTLFAEALRTLRSKLGDFDAGYWSLYEQSGTRMKMLASPFYHSLHIVQLRVMYRLTGEALFSERADRWDAYRRSWLKRNRALLYKATFKVLYY